MKLYFILFLIISQNIFADAESECLNRITGDLVVYENNFCGCAKYYAGNLGNEDDRNQDIAKINELRKQVDILNSIERMRSDYVTSFKNLTPNELKLTAADRLKDYNKALVSGALLITIKSFFKQNSVGLNNGTFNYKNYCAQPSNSKNAICKIKNDPKLSNLYGLLGDSIDKFVSSYQAANTGKDTQTFENAIKSLVNSIPEDLDPKIVFEKLDGISTSVKEDLDKINADTISCVRDLKEENCKKEILLSKSDNQKIINQLTLPTPISDDSKTVIEIASLNKVENAIKTQLSSKIQNAFDHIEHNFPEKIDLLNGIDTKLMGLLSLDKKNGINNKLKSIKENCGTEKISEKSSQSEINACYGQFDELFNKLTDNKTISDLNNQISELQKKLSEKNQKDKSNNLLKKYLGTKYYRQCHDSNMSIVTRDISSCGIQNVTGVTDFKIADQSLSIIGKLTPAEELEKTFTKKEILEFQNACPTIPDKKTSALCETLKNETTKTNETRDSSEWKEIRKKNDLVYDRFGHAKIVPKQSTGSMWAGAALPVLVQSIPMWMNNIGQSMQIDAMTQQAIWQKQWMSDMNIINNAYLNNIYFPSLLGNPTSNVSGFNFSTSNIGTTSTIATSPVFKGFSF